MTDIAKIRTGKVKGTMNSNNLSDYYYNHSFMDGYNNNRLNFYYS